MGNASVWQKQKTSPNTYLTHEIVNEGFARGRIKIARTLIEVIETILVFDNGTKNSHGAPFL